MSFANSIARPVIAAGRPLLQGASLTAMGRTLGILVGAGVLGAVYQLTSDETKASINSMRIYGQFKRQRHEAILVATLGSALSPDLQNQLLRSRNAFKTAMKLLADPLLSVENRETLRSVIQSVCQSPVA